jgi:electron transfer flavoprotein beta subunit
VKILVTAKRVTDPYSKIVLKPDRSGIQTDNVEFKMNPFCEIAVEEALRLVDAAGGGEIIVVAVGDEEATKEVRTALAMGADRGVLVRADERQLDSDVVARILVALVHKESPDLVVLGKQAIDGDNNQVAQLTAEYLGWPQATFAYKIELTDGNKGARVQREVDGGVETVEVTLPAVLTTDLRLNEPRYASLPGIMKAKKKPLDEVTPADLGVDTALTVETVGFEPPPGRKAGVKVKTVDELIEKLAGEAKAL